MPITGPPPAPTPVPSVPQFRPPTITVGGPSSTVFFGGGGLTPVDLVATPWDYPERRGAIGDGIHDDTQAILDTIAASPWTVLRKAGYRITAPITGPSNRLVTAPFGVATFKPDAGCVAALRPGSNWVVDGIAIDGVLTAGKTGLDLGMTGLTNIVKISNMQISNFLGVGARGIGVGDMITASLYDVAVDNCDSNIITQGAAGGPTNMLFVGCQFRSAIRKGVYIVNGYSLNFFKCLFEANFEEGFYLQNTGDNAAEIDCTKCWFEDNWRSAASGAARHAKYHFFCDGANGPSGTIRPRLRDCKFTEGVTGARAIHLTNALDYKIDNCKLSNEAGQILVDGTSYGEFVSWPESNGAFLSTVTANVADPLAAFSSKSTLLDGHGWIAAPALQNGWVNFGGATSNAQYMLDVSGWVHLRGTIKSGVVAPATLLFTLPAGYRPPFQIIVITISNDVAASISVGADGTVKTNAGVSNVYLSLDGVSFRVT